uniref:RtcB family protein n=1 Tax=Alloprevotella sp. TaxID=1872471 RepID=UPI004026C30E
MKNVKIFAKTIEQEAKEQIKRMAASEAYRDCQIRIMPDCHAGKGSTIGTVIKIAGKVVPNTVGVDIGCGMLVVQLGKKDVNLSLLDRIINESVPSGFDVHEQSQLKEMSPLMLRCLDMLHESTQGCFDHDYIGRSLGTLGGGNHFIELNEDEQGCKYLVIHSGSRNLGVKVCNYFQHVAQKNMNHREERKRIIEDLKRYGLEREINNTLRRLGPVPPDLAYLKGKDLRDYYLAAQVCQDFAYENRWNMANTILRGLELWYEDSFTTMHNYFDISSRIIRKGAVRAEKYDKLIIPLNMRDGSLICRGKGNEDWLCSAPHGAGRLMSRAKVKETFTMEEYSKEMQGIYSTSVCESTIDESPMAYKSAEEIEALIGDTVEVVKRIKPIYNFKAKG